MLTFCSKGRCFLGEKLKDLEEVEGKPIMAADVAITDILKKQEGKETFEKKRFLSSDEPHQRVEPRKNLKSSVAVAELIHRPDRQTNRQRDRQADRQTDKQTEPSDRSAEAPSSLFQLSEDNLRFER